MCFTASAVYVRGLPQIYEQTSEKHQACLNVFTASAENIRDLSQI